MNIQKVENLINLISTLSTEEVEFLKSQFNSNVNKNNNIEFLLQIVALIVEQLSFINMIKEIINKDINVMVVRKHLHLLHHQH